MSIHNNVFYGGFQLVSKPGPGCSKRRKLNELVMGHFVNCFSRFNIQYSDIFC